MSISPQKSSPPKRPRLSLQIKASEIPQTLGKSSTALKADTGPTTPTAFNTLSNAYAVAIENASPRTPRPSISLPHLAKRTSLRLETRLTPSDEYILPSQRTQTPGPFTINYPDTPKSAFQDHTPTATHPQVKALTMTDTFTPPQSAGSTGFTDVSQQRVFTFSANKPTRTYSPTVDSPRTPRRRATIGSQCQVAPYTHPRSLRSILRNSPLPPRSTVTPGTPSRMSLHILNRSNKKVGYNVPLTQTITTNKYVKSHIDLLHEDSPIATDPESATSDTLDQTMKYTGDETRDGGHTPGPFEEMRRRMADSELETPARRKRKRREKKHKWEWTITSTDGIAEPRQENGTGELEQTDLTPITAANIEKTPTTAIWREVSVTDSETSTEGDRRGSVESEMSSSEMSLEMTLDERPGTNQSL
ncbi:hypothetical protein BJ878DRAFT_412363 [Calycina marina]|uniref:Uncharacterized protein n=1 Tax=Calycina marina TaxID=1763456 RepID=A0A9P8CKI4_9HELO|nr:hypothetical protein BJ878DRAFT_412363 [Calycina marina]